MQPSIGIDLGTTNCCVAVYNEDKVIIVPNVTQGNRTTTPSYVEISEDGTKFISYGTAAKDQAYENPENTIFDVKRIIGKPMNDEDLQKDIELWPFSVTKGDKGQPMIKVVKHLHPPQSISAYLLSRLRESVEQYLMLRKSSIKKAVITVPAYFDNDQRQATIDAGMIAGFEEVQILTEPAAAAFAYKNNRIHKSPKKVLIYDLGGGTFDVAIINVQTGIDVMAIGGERHLGGEDFDRRLMEYCAEQFAAEHNVKVLEGKDSSSKQVRDETRRRLRRLQERCENAKQVLSTSNTTTVAVDAFYEGLDLKVRLTREIFETLNETDFQKTITVIDDTITSIGSTKDDIDDVILVGGSTRIPRVRELLLEYFDGKPLNFTINADEAVAFGAARQAAILYGAETDGKNDFFAIQDVTPMSLGTQVVTNELSIIVPRNTKIPAKFQQSYKTVSDNQTAMCIDIYQGEESMAMDNKLLGKFILDGIPEGPAKSEAVEVTMEIDDMGILHVSAVSKSRSNVKENLSITEESMRISKKAITELRKGIAEMTV